MAQIINTNIASLSAQRNLNNSQGANAQALERLSSGLRINSAKDDAAGLAISTRFESQTRGLGQAVRNAGDGVSLAQTAEGALSSITDNLQRVRELAVQSSNGTNSDDDRIALQAEASQLIAEIQRTAEETDFNGRNLFDGDFNGIFQIGANSGQTINVQIGELTADRLGTSQAAGVSARGTDTGIKNGDLVINGIGIAASRAGDDTSSTDNASASAIAKVATINRSTPETGVTAEVLTNVVAGDRQIADATSGTITLNGVEMNVATGGVDASADRQSVVAAINAKSDQTGVVAVDTGDSSTGIRMEAEDGRNIELSFGGSVTSAATGLKGGDDGLGGTFEGGFVLRSNDGSDINVQSGTGSLDNTGLVAGTYKGNVAALSSVQRASDETIAPQQASVQVTTEVADNFDVAENTVIGITLDGAGGAVNLTLDAVENQSLTGLVSDINAKIAATEGSGDDIAGRVEAVSIDNQLVIRATDDPSNELGATSSLKLDGNFIDGNETPGGVVISDLNDGTNDLTATGTDAFSTRASGTLDSAPDEIITGTNDGLSISIIGENGEIASDALTLSASGATPDPQDIADDINAQISDSLALNGRVLASVDNDTGTLKFEAIGSAADGSSSAIRLSGTAINDQDGASPSSVLGASNAGLEAAEVTFFGTDGLDRSTKAQYVSTDDFDSFADLVADDDDVLTISMVTEDGPLSATFDLVQAGGDPVVTNSPAQLLENIRAQLVGSDLEGKIDVAINADNEFVVTNLASESGTDSNLTLSGTFFDAKLENASSNSSITVRGEESQLGNEAASALQAGDLVINDISIRASRAADDRASDTTANSSDAAASGIAMAAAINSGSDQTGVTAVVNKTVVDGGEQVAADNQRGAIMINNVATDTITTTGDADTDRATAISAINAITGQTGVMAVDAGDRIVLEAADGRNVSVAIDTQQSQASGNTVGLQGSSIGLDAAQSGIAQGDLTGADTFTEIAATTYSSVKLESASEFTIDAGSNGTDNLEASGFTVGTFGGAESGQFLKDVDVSTFQGAQDAIVAVDNALNTVSGVRSDLGAIQNRFESTISNLEITRENLTAANSRIRDADFAAESAELSRTQVLQQAGISILAQANQRPQQALTLLG